MTSEMPCEHLVPGGLALELLLDDWLGTAEAIARCPICGRDYLLELMDIDGTRRAWRLAPLDTEASRRLIHDLTRGSCDVNRAATEVHAMKAAHPVTRFVVVSEDGSLAALRLITTTEAQPSTSWRDLPLDGAWLKSHG